jgi:hypothetical protein
LQAFGPPTDTDVPGGVAPAALATAWPADRAEISYEYEDIGTVFKFANTPDRGPCVVTMSTRYPRATLLGLPVFQTPVNHVVETLARAGVRCTGAGAFNNRGATCVFTHGLWMRVYEPHVREVSWSVDDAGDGHIDWTRMDHPVG